MSPPRVRPALLATVRSAFRPMALPRFSAVLLARVEAPPTVSAPLPSAVALPTVRVPAFRVVPPG